MNALIKKELFYKPLFELWFVPTILNDEVEIIEEDKKIDKLDDILHIDDLIPPYDDNLEAIWEQTMKNHNKINGLIDAINNIYSILNEHIDEINKLKEVKE